MSIIDITCIYRDRDCAASRWIKSISCCLISRAGIPLGASIMCTEHIINIQLHIERYRVDRDLNELVTVPCTRSQSHKQVWVFVSVQVLNKSKQIFIRLCHRHIFILYFVWEWWYRLYGAIITRDSKIFCVNGHSNPPPQWLTSAV